MEIIATLVWEIIQGIIGRKERQRGKTFWGLRLVLLGAILTLFAIVIFVISLTHGGIDTFTLIVTGPFLLVGIPSLVIGIILINNP